MEEEEEIYFAQFQMACLLGNRNCEIRRSGSEKLLWLTCDGVIFQAAEETPKNFQHPGNQIDLLSCGVQSYATAVTDIIKKLQETELECLEDHRRWFLRCI